MMVVSVDNGFRFNNQVVVFTLQLCNCKVGCVLDFVEIAKEGCRDEGTEKVSYLKGYH